MASGQVTRLGGRKAWRDALQLLSTAHSEGLLDVALCNAVAGVAQMSL